MATTTQTDREARLIEGNVRIYLEIKSAYDECTPEIQQVIDSMLAICNSQDADEDQKRRAMHTIIEALFPALAADLLDTIKCVRTCPESQAYEMVLDEQEATFAERLRRAMEAKGCTQEELAAKVGVRQSAISNMLNRQCRPQTRTVLRLAEALEMPTEELWPEATKAD
jgi:ribosome-binding protein aMBF1 (putative translation factor)